MRCSQILTVGIYIDGSGFNPIGGHGFQQDVLRISLQVDLPLTRMDYEMFSNPH